MDAAYTLEYELFEKKHWWHVARGELINWAIDRFVPEKQTASWLDIGCGTGVLLESYGKIPAKQGIEMDEGSVQRAQSKGLQVRQTSDTKDYNYKQFGTFDLITLCDVIEHIDHDDRSIAGVYDALKPGGTVLVTVPALKSLWSAHDVRNHHFRRYVKKELLALFPRSKWKIAKVSYFSTFLLPMIWSYRQLKNLRHGTDPSEAESDKKFGPPLIDRTFLGIFRTECRLIRWMGMPVGSSLILIARKM